MKRGEDKTADVSNNMLCGEMQGLLQLYYIYVKWVERQKYPCYISPVLPGAVFPIWRARAKCYVLLTLLPDSLTWWASWLYYHYLGGKSAINKERRYWFLREIPGRDDLPPNGKSTVVSSWRVNLRLQPP
jgi:hypothetical protein